MSNQINNYDKETSMLVKRGIQHITSTDFTDRIMNKIASSKSLKVKTSVSLRISWVFIGITLLLLPFVIFFITENFNVVFPYFKEFNDPNLKFVLPFIILIIVSIVLFQIENLVKLTIN